MACTALVEAADMAHMEDMVEAAEEEAAVGVDTAHMVDMG